MPSPFPGMNPYLEQDGVWRDFLWSLCVASSRALIRQVRSRYIVLIDEDVYRRPLTADEWGPMRDGFDPPEFVADRRRFWVVRELKTREPLTAVELLSPTIKRPGPEREHYLAKRRATLTSGVHLVEIDLFRGGLRVPAEGLPDCDYCVTISRVEDRPASRVYPIRLRERLPVIPIPLGPSVPPEPLDLQAALHEIFESARYDYYIYDEGTPQPPLSAEDDAWARRLISGQTSA